MPLKVVECLKQVINGCNRLLSFLPRFAVYRANDEIVMVNQMRVVLQAHPLQEIIQFILVSNQQVTARTVATRFVQTHGLGWFDKNQERLFPQSGFAIALWAAGKTSINMGIEEKVMLRR